MKNLKRVKQILIKKEESSRKSGKALAEELNEMGYRRVSNRYRIISRVDRDNWFEIVNINIDKNNISHQQICMLRDNYRRCHSKDIKESVPLFIFKHILSSNNEF